MQPQEEYIEQAFFFSSLLERLNLQLPMQDILAGLREEVLATTKLPMAVEFLRDELMHSGVISTAMQRLPHYFSAFQSFVMAEAESDRGRFDFRVGLEILQKEAEYRSGDPQVAGMFLYQFEALCRNRLAYDEGLNAISKDPAYDEAWRAWVMIVRKQIGIIEFGDLIYVRSEHYAKRQAALNDTEAASVVELPAANSEAAPVLFGEKEGRIALANRRKDPLLMLSAFQRHLGYPAVPRLSAIKDDEAIVPQLARRLERLETRFKLMEDEQRGGIDLTQFYEKPDGR